MPEFFTKIKKAFTTFPIQDLHQSELEAKRHDASKFQSAPVCNRRFLLHFHAFEFNLEVLFSFCIDQSATCSSVILLSHHE
jgi:hypothetical protein